MFGKILIANRGEIACRIMRTARRLGIATVAVYSEADHDALHVAMADEAVPIGPAPAAKSYLATDTIVEAARASGAEAVHPGYGFLSENAAFARALEAASIVFIGPPAAAIEAMGDKAAAKEIAAAAGVATVPGHAGVLADEAAALAAAKAIGYPVMLKAAAGGGGKGMRMAGSARELKASLSSAGNEARAAFGDDRLLLEKAIESPRHIEIQILADAHGNVVHLGERECSVQRRYQKVIEEAPSPFLDEATRAAMGAAAVCLARQVGYVSAGTVEFIVDRARNFYFLEVNTRLQVEHPVTELVTGIDLVEQMIRVAAGERLGFAQDDIGFQGWAVEARVYAEDPTRGFLPSSGRLVRFRAPPQGCRDGATLRCDTGVEEGSTISIHYDPMIAKLIAHGASRDAAAEGLRDALDRFAIEGISHNIAFLAAVIGHPRWREGRLSTAFIAEEYPDGFRGPAPNETALPALVAIAAALDRATERRRPGSGPQAEPLARQVSLGEDWHAVRITEGERELRFTVEGDPAEHLVTWDWRPGLPVFEGILDGVPIAAHVRPVLGGHVIAHRGFEVEARLYSPRQAELMRLMPRREPPDTSKLLLCPMPGLVVSIDVAAGQEVKAGEPLCVVEAMKMENVLRAERDLKVAVVKVAPGASLAVDAVIMEFA